MRRRVALTGALALALATACGGDKASTTTEPTGGTTGTVTNGTFRATINGTSWSANGAVGVSRTTTNNIVAVAAVSPTYTIAFGISQLTAPGTFSLNAGQLNLANVSAAAGQSWSTVAQGGTGSIVITTFTANRIAGTFSFTAAALSGGATGTISITNGSFDVTY